MRVINMKSLVVAALGLILSVNALGEDVEAPTRVAAGCSAALKCTPIEFCTANGMISNTSVVLSREQNLYRVPLTDCRDLETGRIGKCCRDPYYTDPWPVNQIGKWVPGVFGGNDGQYKEGEKIADEFRKTTPKPVVAQAVQFGIGQLGVAGQGELLQQGVGQIAQQGIGQIAQQGVGQIAQQEEAVVVQKEEVGQIVQEGGAFGIAQGGGGIGVIEGGGAIGVIEGGGQYVQQGFGQYEVGGIGQALLQGYGTAIAQKIYRVFLQRYSAGAQCGLPSNLKPLGNHNEQEVDFAEIPWQAMVLEKTNKSLLCGGVITRPDVVLTSAACVDGLDAKNILIKGGEWKLGVDEEPLPFQIVQVKAVLMHPFYESGTYQYDVAILVLAENLRFAKNIYPICMPSAEESFAALYGAGGAAAAGCFVTGWGKEVLQAHRLGSVMHSLNVSVVDPVECQAKISKDYPKLLEYFDKDSSACAQPENPLQNICSVDIGSALACPTADGHYVLKGIYSWDSGCRVLGNQIGAFYKFDLEWYEWALGFIESIRFAQFSKGALFTGAVGKVKAEGEGLALKQEGLELGQAGAGLLAGQSIFYQTQPKIITYTTKPEIITYTTKPEIITYTTKPKIITYTTKPEIITYTTKPKLITYTTKPEIISYTTKPEIFSYATQPKVVSYVSQPQVASFLSAAQGASFVSEPQVASFVSAPQAASFVSEPQFVSYESNPQLAGAEISGSAIGSLEESL